MLTTIIIIIVLIAVIVFINIYNKFKKLEVKITESESTIDVALTQRHDMLIKMMDACKQYAKHEVDTFEDIVEIRKGMPVEEKEEAVHQMENVTKEISVLAEAYPELRSAEVFRELQSAIDETENDLQGARRFFNGNVSAFNQLLAQFPSNFIGKMMGLSKKEFFEIEDHKKADVNISL